ncbi:uncharacterized protein N7459_006586 [Penicillium hispanicum]|uniref:uncharacterized protein n=1 Tax=Penicillium hispanicum TaxID=1080232 RepID=UPI002541330D|nr:uncharacterized protein N7459_006586 [Penicillium hispanicum]KAJ5577622.1 hypothetical protein N7459_006586 [Penicillium hispanicum]
MWRVALRWCDWLTLKRTIFKLNQQAPVDAPILVPSIVADDWLRSSPLLDVAEESVGDRGESFVSLGFLETPTSSPAECDRTWRNSNICNAGEVAHGVCIMQSALKPVTGPKKEIHDLTGRVAVVLGGALGIGYEVSRAFVVNGARVIMVNRKEDQGDDAVKTIKKEAGDGASIEWIPCDMGDLKQIKETFTKLRSEEKRLDLLVLSAGINANQYGETNDRIDRHFQVNWLGQFYVCNVLYPLLHKTSKFPDTPAPRIVFEASEQHRAAPKAVHFASLDEINNDQLSPTELYGRSKLAIILGVKYGLVARVIQPNKDNIYALSVHPGAVNTAMQQQWKDAYPGVTGKLITSAMLAVGRDVEQGSFSALYAASSPDIEKKGWNGYYLTDPDQPGKESAQASDATLGAALWDLSQRIIKEKVGDDAITDWNANV